MVTFVLEKDHPVRCMEDKFGGVNPEANKPAQKEKIKLPTYTHTHTHT